MGVGKVCVCEGREGEGLVGASVCLCVCLCVCTCMDPVGLPYNWQASLLYIVGQYEGTIVVCWVDGMACAIIVGLQARLPEDVLVYPLAKWVMCGEEREKGRGVGGRGARGRCEWERLVSGRG